MRIVLLIALSLNLNAQSGVMMRDASGATIVRPVGRGLYVDSTNNTLRTLSWGGLFNPLPNIVWATVKGGNAQPVRLDPSAFKLVSDPVLANQSMLTAQSQLPFTIELVDSHTLVLGQTCSPVAPCNFGFEGAVSSVQNSCTVSVQSGTGSVLMYVSPANELLLSPDTSNLGFTLTGSCSADTPAATFPEDSIPLYSWTVTNGQFDAAGGKDWRCFLCRDRIILGDGISQNTPVAGWKLVSVDTTVIPTYATTAPATHSAPCTPMTIAFDDTAAYICIRVNQWIKLTAVPF